MQPAPASDRVRAMRACPVCDSTVVTRLQEMRFALPEDHPLTDRYAVVCCDACGMVYADTPSSQADYDSYYADLSKYSDTVTGTGAGSQGWDRQRLADTAATIAERLGNANARVVDIGCANGGLLAELAALGYHRLYGVDPAPACVAATAAIPGVSAGVGTLFSMPNAALHADCVVLSHVLEHVRDVRSALRQLYSMLAPGGLAYVEVPDATRYAEYLVAPFQDFNVEHINHFSPVSLANALADNGFSVETTIPKTIEASAGVPYPAVAAVARRSDGDSQRITPDETAKAVMAHYVAESRAQVAVLDQNLRQALRGIDEIVIWGAGQTTLTLLSHTNMGGARVLALTDSNPRYHGRRLGGVPVVAPNDIARLNAPILIGSLIHHVAIEQRIREMGLPNRVVRLSVQ